MKTSSRKIGVTEIGAAIAAAVLLGAAPSQAQCWRSGASPAPGLGARKGHSLAYHAGIRRVVLFGGVDGTTVYDDTWIYDGVTWARGPSIGPSRRSGCVMTYDSRRDMLVLFGGVDDQSYYYNDTWEFDGSQWNFGPTADPNLTPRSRHGMAYDANRDVVVLFGGHDFSVLFNDTWEYDGLTWVAGPNAPGGLTPRSHHSMAYDPGIQRVVLFGGDQGFADWTNDTWIYDGTGWAKGPDAPPGLARRASQAMAYDGKRNAIVMFGGWDITSYFNDTWEFDGFQWNQEPPATIGLSGRQGHAVAYDEDRQKVVLFGGADASDEQNDTWEYPGTCCPTITLSPATLPGGYVGISYSQTITASGGTGPYTFSISAGTLPPGLTLSGAGLLSGTPTAAGSYVFTVLAVDSTGCAGLQSYTVAVSACSLTFSPASLPSGSVGVPYSQTLTATGGSSPYQWVVTAGAVPIGLTLGSGGLLSGTPSAAGTFGFTVKATDSNGCYDTHDYVMGVSGASGAKDNLILGRGLGYPNRNEVKVYRQNGSATGVDILAYSAGQWGVNVASGNATGAALAQMFTGPGPGPIYGPQVRGFFASGSAMGKINFFAYGTLRYGVNAGTAELDDDGYDELLTGAGPGAVFGPHVRGFNYDNVTVASMGKVSYFAYATLKYGVNVASGNVDGDNYGEILTGPGPGGAFSPTVRGFNYDDATLTGMGKINFNAFSVTQFGANVAGGDVDADGFGEIAAALGPGGGAGFPPRLKGFNFDAISIAGLAGFDVTLPVSPASYGARVGLSDITGDGRADLLAGGGRDPLVSATVRPYVYVSGQLGALLAFDPFPGASYGVNAAGGALGY